MSRRNVLYKHPVWTSYNSAGTATPSESTTVDQVDIVKYIITVASSVVGSITVQFTDDRFENQEVWKDLDFDQTLTINGATDTEYTILIEEHSCKKLRLSFTNNAGTGNINSWVTATNVGA